MKIPCGFSQRGLSPDYWMMAPRAPHPAEPSGFSWRPYQPLTEGRPSLEMLLPAAEALIRLIDEYSASVKLDALQFDLLGFSQGAAMVKGMFISQARRWVLWALFPGS
jgi:predicted esterase